MLWSEVLKVTDIFLIHLRGSMSDFDISFHIPPEYQCVSRTPCSTLALNMLTDIMRVKSNICKFNGLRICWHWNCPFLASVTLSNRLYALGSFLCWQAPGHWCRRNEHVPSGGVPSRDQGVYSKLGLCLWGAWIEFSLNLKKPALQITPLTHTNIQRYFFLLFF